MPTRAGASTRRSSARWPRSATGSAGRSCCRSSARSSATWPSVSGGPTPASRSAFLGNTLTLSSFIAIGCIIFVWAFNIFGLRMAVWFTYLCAALLMVPLVLFVIVPYFTGDWHGSNVHATFTGPWGGIKLAIVYMFILAWSAYGTEACATFAPEYKSTRDVHQALRSAATFMLLDLRAAPARPRRRPGRRQGGRDRRGGAVLHLGDDRRWSATARRACSPSASSPACCCR